MNCDVCGSKMSILFSSAVCDLCEPAGFQKGPKQWWHEVWPVSKGEPVFVDVDDYYSSITDLILKIYMNSPTRVTRIFTSWPARLGDNRITADTFEMLVLHAFRDSRWCVDNSELVIRMSEKRKPLVDVDEDYDMGVII